MYPNDAPTAPPSAPRTRRRLYYYLLLGALALAVAGAGTAAIVVLAFEPTLPPVSAITETPLKVPMRVYTADGQLIGEFGEERRIVVTRAEVPDQLVKAILAAEDDSFYSHSGVDFLGIVRAALANLRAGGKAEGASTITMQVARNYFLSPEKTYTRKIKEVLLAFKLERELTKDQILELYINKIFLGNRAYGFAAAAQVYFGKTLDQLTLPEMALLAGLPKAPSRDNPISNPQNAQIRRDYVLGRMLKLGYIDQLAYDQARATPVAVSRHPLRYGVDAPYVAEMVRQYMVRTYDQKTYANGFHVYTTINSKDQLAADKALKAALRAYDERHGYRGPAGHEAIDDKTDHLKLDDTLKDYQAVADLVPAIVLTVGDKSADVYTQDGTRVTLGWPGLAWARPYVDENHVGPEPQNAGQILHVGDIVYVREDGAGTWWLGQPPKAAGALVSLRPSDGAILALAGGFDFYTSNFNHAVQAQRQPGSSFKPFIYSAALEKGFTAASLVSGAPIVIRDPSLEGEWRPEDYERKFVGPTRLRKALAASLNLVSVRLLRSIGPAYAADYAERFGFDSKQLPRNLSLALGTATVTPLEMARAYAVFANGGFRVDPYFITRIEDGNHKVLAQFTPAVACLSCDTASAVAQKSAAPPKTAPRVISPQNDFIITSMLKDVINIGTGQAASALGRHDLAGKTGTTNDFRDAWFCGFNPDVVGVAWVGLDDNSSLGRGEPGARAALPMWMDYMRDVLAGTPEKSLPMPNDIVTATIDRDSGEVAPPNDARAMQEYFVAGTVPGGAPAVAPGTAPTTSATPTPPPPPAPGTVREGLF